MKEEPIDKQLTKIQDDQTKGQLRQTRREDIREGHCSLGESGSAGSSYMHTLQWFGDVCVMYRTLMLTMSCSQMGQELMELNL